MYMITQTNHAGTSKMPAIADTGATIHVEHPAEGVALVRVTYPDDRRRAGARSLAIACALLCLLPVVTWLLTRHGPSTPFAIIASSLLAAYLIAILTRQFSAVTRSYTLRADPTGLTLETSAGRRHSNRHLPRARIADLAPAFSFYRGPHSLFRCWLQIQTTSPRSTLRCLHNLGGDHLAHIANTLRPPLNLPHRSWP